MEKHNITPCMQCGIQPAQDNDVVCNECRMADCAAQIEMEGKCEHCEKLKKHLTTRTILFRNLTGTEARLVDDFAREMVEKNDLDVEVLTSPSNLQTEKTMVDELKKHFKRNKDRYMVCGVCFVLGGVAALLLTPKRYDKVTIVNPSSVSVSLGDGEEVFGFESFDYRDQ